MGLTDALGSGGLAGLADKAMGMLGGDGSPAPPSAPANVDVKFHKHKPFDSHDASQGGAFALDHDNKVDQPMPIEFIHYGYVHTDAHDSFPHGNLVDTSKTPLPSDHGSHAIMFRAALEREAILKAGFVKAAKDVLQEIKDSTGGMGSLAGAAGAVIGAAENVAGALGLGGGGPKDSGPDLNDPSSFDPYMTQISAAGGKVNNGSIQYKVIHQAGIDLHQARGNYAAFAKKAASAHTGDSIFGKLTDSIPALPGGVGDTVKMISGILFKMYDVYKAWYFVLRDSYEDGIMDACHDRSIAAIDGRYVPIFDVWSSQVTDDDPATNPAADILKTGNQDVDKALKPAFDPVNNAYREADSDLRGVKKKWKEFWDVDSKPGPGQGQIDACFAACADPSRLMVDVFGTALGGITVPSYVATPIGKITAINVGMLQQVFYKMQDPQVLMQLNEDAFIAAGHKYIRNALFDLFKSLVPDFGNIGGQQIPGMKVNDQTLGGGNLPTVNRDMLGKKAFAMLDDELGKDINPILELAMGMLHDRIVATRKDAVKANSLVMEAFLAQIPEYVALMTRNTFFPVFQLVADKVFGKAAGVAQMLSSPVKAMMDKARDTVKDAKHQVTDLDSSIDDRVNDVGSSVRDKQQMVVSEVAKDTFGVVSVGKVLQDDQLDSMQHMVTDPVDSILGKDSGGAKKAASGGGGSFPGDPRVPNGSGNDIKKAEWEEVDTKQHVDAV